MTDGASPARADGPAPPREGRRRPADATEGPGAGAPGASGASEVPAGAPRAPIDSALPSTTARALAFAAIVVSGICGGLIGWRTAELSISGDAGAIPGVAGLVGAIATAGGVAVVAVLVLRAMGEWRTIVDTGDPAAARGRRPS